MGGNGTLRRAWTTIAASPLRLAPVVLLAGCITLAKPPASEELAGQVLPDGAPPPTAWTGGGASTGAVGGGWLATFADADLDALVAEALVHNADLQAAAASVEQAAGYVRVAGGKIYPSVDLLARGGSELGDNTGLEGGLVSASWELDVWGRVRYSIRGAKAQYAASESDFAYARQSLAALVAKSWFLATEATLQRNVASDMVGAAASLLALAEQRFRIGAGSDLDVTAARLPRFSLTASVSDLSSEFFVLKNRDNPVWSVGGTVFAPLFSGGELKAKVGIRTAEQKEAMAHYVQTALKAFGDVENALSSEFALADREQILTAAVGDAERALRLAETRYRVGSGDLRQVEQQQLAYESARMNLLRVQSERRVQRVNLHLALGGDFAPSA